MYMYMFCMQCLPVCVGISSFCRLAIGRVFLQGKSVFSAAMGKRDVSTKDMPWGRRHLSFSAS